MLQQKVIVNILARSSDFLLYDMLAHKLELSTHFFIGVKTNWCATVCRVQEMECC